LPFSFETQTNPLPFDKGPAIIMELRGAITPLGMMGPHVGSHVLLTETLPPIARYSLGVLLLLGPPLFLGLLLKWKIRLLQLPLENAKRQGFAFRPACQSSWQRGNYGLPCKRF
jgi:hypothetical protein